MHGSCSDDLRFRHPGVILSGIDLCQLLRAVADEGGGAYVHAGTEEFGLNPIISDLKRLEDEQFKSVIFEEYDEQYMYFFGVALALLALESLIGSRRAKRRLF